MKKVIRVIFLFGVLAFIYYMSSQNGFKSNSYNIEMVKILKNKGGIDLYSLFSNNYVDIIIRKLGHFFEFSLLSAAAYLFFSAFKFRWVTVLTIVFCIFLGFVDEFHQLYVPGRTSSVIDVIIDSIGVMVTVSVISLIRIIKFELSNGEDNYVVRNDRSSL